ncbi:MAG: FHIPEP family type III secretion protein [Candidatus Sericytochromatia bacterium]
MIDRERALHLLMGRYRYEEAMRLFGEYCLLMEEDWNDFVARHSPLRLRQLHKQLHAVGLWPPELHVAPAQGTGLLKAMTGLLDNLRAPAAPAAPAAAPTDAANEAPPAPRDPEQVLQSLVAPALSIELPPALANHPAIASDDAPLHEAIAQSRYKLAQELGFVFPLVHLRDNVEIAENRYAIRVNGETMAEGHLLPELVAALGPELPSSWAKEPHPVRPIEIAWIAADAAPAWHGGTQTPHTLLAEHVESVVRKFAHRLFNNHSLDLLLRAYEPEIGKDTLAELFGRFMSLTELRLVLQGMLKAGYNIRNLPRIVDILMRHYITYLAEKPLSMDETWKISSHIPFFSTEELTHVICRGLGLPAPSERRSSFAATMERIVREAPPAHGLEGGFTKDGLPSVDGKDGWERWPPGSR